MVAYVRLLGGPPEGDVQAHSEDRGEGAARAEPGRHGGEAGQPARYADGDGGQCGGGDQDQDGDGG